MILTIISVCGLIYLKTCDNPPQTERNSITDTTAFVVESKPAYIVQ